MGDSKDSTDLTPRMAEILELMLYGFDEGLNDPTSAVAEVLGESRSAVAAVTRQYPFSVDGLVMWWGVPR